jgi:hypothetical protein
MVFWFEFLDIHMNEKTTCNDYHNLNGKHKYLSNFECFSFKFFLAHGIVTVPISRLIRVFVRFHSSLLNIYVGKLNNSYKHY